MSAVALELDTVRPHVLERGTPPPKPTLVPPESPVEAQPGWTEGDAQEVVTELCKMLADGTGMPSMRASRMELKFVGKPLARTLNRFFPDVTDGPELVALVVLVAVVAFMAFHRAVAYRKAAEARRAEAGERPRRERPSTQRETHADATGGASSDAAPPTADNPWAPRFVS